MALLERAGGRRVVRGARYSATSWSWRAVEQQHHHGLSGLTARVRYLRGVGIDQDVVAPPGPAC